MAAAHLSISFLRNDRRYPDDLRSDATISAPISLNRACTAGVSIVAMMAACSRRAIGSGVLFGRKMANHVLAAKLVSPCSVTLATFGKIGARSLLNCDDLHVLFLNLRNGNGHDGAEVIDPAIDQIA